MSYFLILKALHIVGAAILFGTGVGIAFFMLMAHRTRDMRLIAHTAGVVVIADTIFTATSAVLQPITGFLLATAAGYDPLQGWIVASIALYLVVGAFWLPVVWIQLRMRDMARAAVRSGAPTPDAYLRLWRIWFVCGFPAFAAMIAILWLMVAKPSF